MKFHAPVAQLDRASVYGTEGWWFESPRARFFVSGDMPRKFPQTKSVKSSTKNLPAGFFSFLEDPLFFKWIFSYIGDQFILIDSKGCIVFVNDAVVDGLGYSRSYILSKKITHFLHETLSVAQWKKKYFDVLKRREVPLSYRLECATKSRGVRTLDVTSVYMVYQGRGFVFSISRDVTRHVQLQNALYDSKNLYRFLTEGARDGIAALDEEGRFVYANASLQDTLGFRAEKYRGRHFIKFVPKETVHHAESIFNRAKKGEKHINAMIDIRSEHGEIVPFEVSVTPMLKSGKVVSIHLIARDLRARRKIESMERQAEKMEALRYFITGTAQELKNPLLGITRRAQTLLKKYADRDFEYISYREFQDIISNLSSINDQVQYCYETSRRLTAMGQKKAGMRGGHCGPCSIIRGVIKDKETYLLENDVRPQLSLADKDIEIRMSALDLTQILHNLIDNAVQAMPSGGVMAVKTCLAKHGREFVIEIKDCGVGIPKDQLRHIFEPFFTTKIRGVRKNSGLGLSIVYSLVKDCQGTMQIKSSLRQGTVVRVFIPVYRPRKEKKT